MTQFSKLRKEKEKKRDKKMREKIHKREMKERRSKYVSTAS